MEKPKGGFLLGTSPEFEIGLYTAGLILSGILSRFSKIRYWPIFSSIDTVKFHIKFDRIFILQRKPNFLVKFYTYAQPFGLLYIFCFIF